LSTEFIEVTSSHHRNSGRIEWARLQIIVLGSGGIATVGRVVRPPVAEKAKGRQN